MVPHLGLSLVPPAALQAIEEQLRNNAKGAFSGNKDVISKLKELRDQRATIIVGSTRCCSQNAAHAPFVVT